MAGEIISECRATSNRNGGRHHRGFAGDFPRNPHAGRTTLSVSSTHGEQQTARRAYLRIARFFASLRAKAEQLDAVQRWYRILSEALRKYLHGRQLIPPARLQPG